MTPMLLSLFLLQAAPTLAPPEPPCSVADEQLPENLSGWRDAGGSPVTALTVGRAGRITLEPVARVGFAAAPERAPGAGTRGAAIPVTIERAGRYVLALSGAVWADLVVGTGRIASVAHGHGPRCSGIRKLVTFDLPAGRHLVQLSGSDAREVTAMVTRAEGRSRRTQR